MRGVVLLLLAFVGCTFSVQTVRVVCDTTKGGFRIAVQPRWAPIGAKRFLDLVDTGFFKDVALFRVLPNFISQFGVTSDPAIQATWDSTEPLEDEPNPFVGQTFARGMLAFAGSGPNSRTTQMFIATEDSETLGAQVWETPFAIVDIGMEVVDSFYSYGDLEVFGGDAPDPNRIAAEGTVWLQDEYPYIDYILSCRRSEVLPVEVPTQRPPLPDRTNLPQSIQQQQERPPLVQPQSTQQQERPPLAQPQFIQQQQPQPTNQQQQFQPNQLQQFQLNQQQQLQPNQQQPPQFNQQQPQPNQQQPPQFNPQQQPQTNQQQQPQFNQQQQPQPNQQQQPQPNRQQQQQVQTNQQQQGEALVQLSTAQVLAMLAEIEELKAQVEQLVTEQRTPPPTPQPTPQATPQPTLFPTPLETKVDLDFGFADKAESNEWMLDFDAYDPATPVYKTYMGCTCKEFTELLLQDLEGNSVGGGLSHYGCTTGPYEEFRSLHLRLEEPIPWCDTVEPDCNQNQGWDFCDPVVPDYEVFPSPMMGENTYWNQGAGLNGLNGGFIPPIPVPGPVGGGGISDTKLAPFPSNNFGGVSASAFQAAANDPYANLNPFGALGPSQQQYSVPPGLGPFSSPTTDQYADPFSINQQYQNQFVNQFANQYANQYPGPSEQAAAAAAQSQYDFSQQQGYGNGNGNGMPGANLQYSLQQQLAGAAGPSSTAAGSNQQYNPTYPNQQYNPSSSSYQEQQYQQFNPLTQDSSYQYQQLNPSTSNPRDQNTYDQYSNPSLQNSYEQYYNPNNPNSYQDPNSYQPPYNPNIYTQTQNPPSSPTRYQDESFVGVSNQRYPAGSGYTDVGIQQPGYSSVPSDQQQQQQYNQQQQQYNQQQQQQYNQQQSGYGSTGMDYASGAGGSQFGGAGAGAGAGANQQQQYWGVNNPQQQQQYQQQQYESPFGNLNLQQQQQQQQQLQQQQQQQQLQQYGAGGVNVNGQQQRPFIPPQQQQTNVRPGSTGGVGPMLGGSYDYQDQNLNLLGRPDLFGGTTTMFADRSASYSARPPQSENAGFNERPVRPGPSPATSSGFNVPRAGVFNSANSFRRSFDGEDEGEEEEELPKVAGVWLRGVVAEQKEED